MEWMMENDGMDDGKRWMDDGKRSRKSLYRLTNLIIEYIYIILITLKDKDLYNS